MILGPKNAIDLKIINIYNLERTSTLLFSLEIFSIGPSGLKFCRRGINRNTLMPAKFQATRIYSKKVMAVRNY